jgi:penicillin-binding protein 2
MKLKLLLAPILAVFFLLITRLLHLQIIEGSTYRRLADNNRFFNQTVPAERGVILDRYQQPLVKNTKVYFYNLDDGLYSATQPLPANEALQMMAQEPHRVVYELRRQYLYPTQLAHVLGYTAPATAQDLLSDDQLELSDWLGKMGLEQQFDQYMRGQNGSQLYEVNTLGEKQRLLSETPPTAGRDISTSIDPYLSKIAYHFLGQMQGAVVVLDADTGQVLASVSRPSFNANDLNEMLIDPQLEAQRQLNLRNYFEDERKVFFNRAVSGIYPPGSIFKMVTAMAGLQKEAFDEHKTVLDEGILQVGDYSYANWLYTQRGATDGEIALVRAIARSNDIYFYKAAEWTGPDSIAQQAREFGMGERTGVELPGEAAGLVPDPAWKEETTGERWFLGNTYHLGIGQSDLLVSPLQAAQMVQALVKGGELCSPRLLSEPIIAATFGEAEGGTGTGVGAEGGIGTGTEAEGESKIGGKVEGKTSNGRDASHCRSLGLTEKNLELVLKGMIAACQPGGTASLLFDLNQGFAEANQAESAVGLLNQGAVACKTGTAEFGGQDERGRRRTHGWFVAGTSVDAEEMIEGIEERAEVEGETGLFTAEELEKWAGLLSEQGFPRRVVLVAMVESDDAIPYKEGSHHAAPIVKELLDWMGK